MNACPGYDEYSVQVRCEYKHVPWASYTAGRSAVLTTFRDAEQLYGHSATRGLFDATARANLAREMQWLADPSTADPLLAA